MNRHRQTSLRLTLALAAVITCAAAAQALPQTFVSSTGNNSNTCDRTAPCRTFAGALAKTDMGGEIVVLDSGEYGKVVINQAVRITAVGVDASITATAGSAVTINAASTDAVMLRGLTLNGRGGLHGIDFTAGDYLHVENCVIAGFTQRGVNFHAPGQLFLKDTFIRDNGNTAVYIAPGADEVTAEMDHCRMEKNPYGVVVSPAGSATAKVGVRDSLVAGGTAHGYSAAGAGAQLTIDGSTAAGGSRGFSATLGAKLSVKNCTASNSGVGVYGTDAGTRVSVEKCGLFNNATAGLFVTTSAVAQISNTVVTGNGKGLVNNSSSGTIRSFQNNRVTDNTTNTLGAITPTSQT